MTRASRLPDAAKLEFYRVALSNAKSNEEFLTKLGKVGYSIESLEEASRLYEIARKAFNMAQSAKAKRFEMHEEFFRRVDVLDEQFRVDWKKAGIVFQNDPVAREKLSLKKPYEKAYVKWIEQARKFYKILSDDAVLIERLSKRNFTIEDAAAGLDAIAEIEKARADHIYEKGISQDATTTKDKTLRELSEWMNEFFSLSRIAFRSQPQLMESLGMVVKN